jgi:hypothetical protein
MAKTLKGVSELEAILLAELRNTPHCEGASSVSVYRLAEGRVEHELDSRGVQRWHFRTRQLRSRARRN